MILDWWMEEDVMTAIGFYFGVFTTVIGALWAAYTKLGGSRTSDEPKPSRPSTETSTQATNGIAGGCDVSVGGNVSVSQTPMAAWVVLGFGIICLGLVAIFSDGDDTTITNGANVGGDMNGSSITIGQ